MLLTSLMLLGCQSVNIEDGIIDEEQECFKIVTPEATFFYQKEAGGFSSIVDNEGNDWINFKQDTSEYYPFSAASSYRGLPNLVFRSADSGAGHPGFYQCISELVASNKIRTTSKSGKWQWTWTFYIKSAILSVDRIDPGHPYWFLYEGTIAGKYRPHFQYWGTNNGGPNKTLPDYYFGNALYENWRWIYFGDEYTDRIFYIIQNVKDDLHDTFSYLGNTDLGILSPNGMVVFGFGRTKNATPLMNEEGLTFTIGFIEKKVMNKKDHSSVEKKIRNIMSE